MLYHFNAATGNIVVASEQARARLRAKFPESLHFAELADADKQYAVLAEGKTVLAEQANGRALIAVVGYLLSEPLHFEVYASEGDAEPIVFSSSRYEEALACYKSQAQPKVKQTKAKRKYQDVTKAEAVLAWVPSHLACSQANIPLVVAYVAEHCPGMPITEQKAANWHKKSKNKEHFLLFVAEHITYWAMRKTPDLYTA